LEKEYKAEVEQSRTLQASTRTAPNLSASTSIPPLTEESEKDAICLSLYEDMTELQILNVKLKRDAKSGKEATLNCLHTSHEQKRCKLAVSLSNAKADIQHFISNYVHTKNYHRNSSHRRQKTHGSG
jgi:hypothetical protein